MLLVLLLLRVTGWAASLHVVLRHGLATMQCILALQCACMRLRMPPDRLRCRMLSQHSIVLLQGWSLG